MDLQKGKFVKGCMCVMIRQVRLVIKNSSVLYDTPKGVTWYLNVNYKSLVCNLLSMIRADVGVLHQHPRERQTTYNCASQ